MIDACENDPHDPLPCPAVAFRDDAIVQNMKQLLNVLGLFEEKTAKMHCEFSGVLIVNILPMNAESKALNEVQRKKYALLFSRKRIVSRLHCPVKGSAIFSARAS